MDTYFPQCIRKGKGTGGQFNKIFLSYIRIFIYFFQSVATLCSLEMEKRCLKCMYSSSECKRPLPRIPSILNVNLSTSFKRGWKT